MMRLTQSLKEVRHSRVISFLQHVFTHLPWATEHVFTHLPRATEHVFALGRRTCAHTLALGRRTCVRTLAFGRNTCVHTRFSLFPGSKKALWAGLLLSGTALPHLRHKQVHHLRRSGRCTATQRRSVATLPRDSKKITHVAGLHVCAVNIIESTFPNAVPYEEPDSEVR